MRKRTFILIAMITVLLIAAICGGSCAAAETANAPAVRTILLWAGGAKMDSWYEGPIADRLNKMMDAEIPDNVNPGNSHCLRF